MSPLADLLNVIARGNREHNSPPIHFGDFRFCRHSQTDRRCGKMSDIDCCADCALSGFQILADRIQRGVFFDFSYLNS